MDGCDREPYGVLFNYDTKASEINAQLAVLFANGQRRLRLMIFHLEYDYQFVNGVLVHNPPSVPGGTLVDSTGGKLTPRILANLAGLLAAIKAAGFEEVEIAFGPQGANNLGSWPSWQEAYFQQNWEVIQSTRPVIAAAGIPYHIDLLNEGIPNKAWPFYSMLLEYTQRMWALYVAAYGTADTVGFSMVPQSGGINTATELPNVYGAVWPPVIDLHFYDDAYNAFLATNQITKQQSQRPAWILGEGYYNDSQEAVDLQQAIALTGQPVRYLTQWPIVRDQATLACPQSAPAPLAFGNYQGSGF